MSSKFSSALVVAALLSHTVLAPLTAVAQEQDASPQQVQETTDSNSNESVEATQKEGAESIDDGMPDKTPQDASPQQAQGTTDSNSNESVEATQRAGESIDDWMPDKALQAAVAKTLGLNVSEITKDKMSGLTTLTANSAGIGSLEGIQYASNLEHLDLPNNEISDVTPLKDLSKLSILYLNSNQISDVTPLQQLSNLSWLHLSDNQISDLTPLQNLSNLEWLNLAVNEISDVAPLQQLSNLSNLNLRSNHITDITPLQNLNLPSFYAENQTITLPLIYVLNKQPYSLSLQEPIKGLTQSVLTISPQNSTPWTGSSGKAEWSSASPVPQTGNLVFTWTDQNTNFSGTCTQPYVLSKASITVKDSTIYVGDNWQARDNFDSALDHEGNPLDFSKITVTGTVNTSQPGVYPIVYSYEGLEEKVEVTVLQNQTSVEGHDSTLYTGDSWNAQDNFDGAKDKAGNPVNFQDVQVTGTVDTTQPGKYKITYSYGGVQKEVEVTVLQNQTSVEGHDSTLYTGDSWTAQDNFDGAKDKAGNPVNFQDVQVTGTVDTTQPGKYKVTYSYDGVQKEIEVTVLKNQTSVEGHDSTLYTGDSWNAQDNFDGAKDKAGNPVNFQDVQVTGTVDTTQPGKYKVTYSYDGVQKEIEVTVLQKVSQENNTDTNTNSNSGENKKNENQKPMSTNEKDKALPSTGEKSSVWLFVSGIVFIFASVLALLRFKKKNK